MGNAHPIDLIYFICFMSFMIVSGWAVGDVFFLSGVTLGGGWWWLRPGATRVLGCWLGVSGAPLVVLISRELAPLIG